MSAEKMRGDGVAKDATVDGLGKGRGKRASCNPTSSSNRRDTRPRGATGTLIYLFISTKQRDLQNTVLLLPLQDRMDDELAKEYGK